jgi:hypothetical protein
MESSSTAANKLRDLSTGVTDSSNDCNSNVAIENAAIDGFTTIIDGKFVAPSANTNSAAASVEESVRKATNSLSIPERAAARKDANHHLSRLLSVHRVAVIMRNKSLLATTTATLQALQVKHRTLHFCRNAPRFTDVEIAHFASGYFTVYMVDSTDLIIELHQLRVDGFRVLFAGNAMYTDAVQISGTSSSSSGTIGSHNTLINGGSKDGEEQSTSFSSSVCHYCLPVPCPVLLLQQMLLDHAVTLSRALELPRAASDGNTVTSNEQLTSTYAATNAGKYPRAAGTGTTAGRVPSSVPSSKPSTPSSLAGSNGPVAVIVTASPSATATAAIGDMGIGASTLALGPVPLGREFLDGLLMPCFNAVISFIRTIPAFEHFNISMVKFASMVVKIVLRVLEWFIIERVDAGSTSNMRPDELLSFENHNHLGNDFRFKGTFLGIPIFSRHIEGESKYIAMFVSTLL